MIKKYFRSETLEAVIKWKDELDVKLADQTGSTIPCFLLANKVCQGKPNIFNIEIHRKHYLVRPG